MVLRQICPPALIYLIFSITQVSIDTVQGAYNTALVKIWVAFVFTVLLKLSMYEWFRCCFMVDSIYSIYFNDCYC